MSVSSHRRPAFTMVEMLVVIGIIAVLAGMLLPAINNATRRAKKVEETNRIRQVGIAWNLYANGNDDAALPGYLEDGGGVGEENVQGPDAWNVHYKLPDGENVPYEDAAEWPWRLLAYLDYGHEVILGYLELEEISGLIMSDYTRTDPDGMHRPTKIAEHPAFGYNGYYTGGWWEMGDFGNELRARPKFHDAHAVENGQPTGRRVTVVARSTSSIANPTGYVTFCSSTDVLPGNYHRFTDFQLGSHYVTPPFLAEDEQWNWGRRRPNDPNSSRTQFSLEAMTDTAIPIGRYTGQTTVLYADGHSEPQAPGALRDQRYWISTADSKDYMHTDN